MNQPPSPADAFPGADFDEAAQLADLGVTLEDLDGALAEHETVDLGISDLWVVPDGLEERVVDKAWRSIQNRRSAVAFGELLGLGWRTTRHLIDPIEGQP